MGGQAGGRPADGHGRYRSVSDSDQVVRRAGTDHQITDQIKSVDNRRNVATFMVWFRYFIVIVYINTKRYIKGREKRENNSFKLIAIFIIIIIINW